MFKRVLEFEVHLCLKGCVGFVSLMISQRAIQASHGVHRARIAEGVVEVFGWFC